jgi:hypothetical protein
MRSVEWPERMVEEESALLSCSLSLVSHHQLRSLSSFYLTDKIWDLWEKVICRSPQGQYQIVSFVKVILPLLPVFHITYHIDFFGRDHQNLGVPSKNQTTKRWLLTMYVYQQRDLDPGQYNRGSLTLGAGP